MTRRLRTLAAVAVAAIAAAGLSIGIAGAGAVTPPAGTPDLSQMTVQTSDLGAGSRILAGRYVKPATKVIAEYDRSFASVSTTAGLKLAGLTSAVALTDSTGEATTLFRSYRLIYSSKLGRALLAAALVKSAGKHSGVKLKDVHFGKLASIGVGEQSLIQPLLVRAKHRAVSADFVVLRIGAVLASINVIVLRAHLDRSVATGLAGTVGAHVTAVLAASGASGPSGPTGATG